MRFEKWNIAGFDRDKAQQLCTNEKNPINPLIAVLLASRGITENEKAAEYIDEQAIQYNDPMLMADMDKAVTRIKTALENKEHIAIYGDYDVDGMTSAALLAKWLETKNAKYEIYIPGRLDEGYGLHNAALDTLKEHGADLVITVDCGITAVAEAQHAKKIGIDLIITDHHECKATEKQSVSNELPDASAVVDPKRPDCKYPFKDLAGVGVVYKLICALEGDYLSNKQADRYGQLVALGTVADVMPVTGENRKLITRGLQHMNANPEPGIRELINEACSDPDNITATNISYGLAPRLNAAGRMGDPMLSVKLLLSSDSDEAKQCVAELTRLNDDRRNLEQEIMTDAVNKLKEELKQQGKTEPTDPIVLTGDNWNQGVSGIVAAKLADKYRLPAIIISIDEEGLGKGSSRSYGTFSIYDALSKCTDILETFGGHEMAAGITVKAENVEKLKNRLNKNYKTHIKGTPAMGLDIDFEVTKPNNLLTIENVSALKALEPFGRGNPSPSLCIMGATLISINSIGTGKHTKLRVEKQNANSKKSPHPLECIMFAKTPDDLNVNAGDTVDIAFQPQINDYRDRKTVQLQLLDIRKSQ